jgi:hypothetical protein
MYLTNLRHCSTVRPSQTDCGDGIEPEGEFSLLAGLLAQSFPRIRTQVEDIAHLPQKTRLLLIQSLPVLADDDGNEELSDSFGDVPADSGIDSESSAGLSDGNGNEDAVELGEEFNDGDREADGDFVMDEEGDEESTSDMEEAPVRTAGEKPKKNVSV